MRKAIHHLKKTDPVMASIIAKAGPYSIQYREPGFQMLVRSIVGQQLSGKAAATIYGRLRAAAVGADAAPETAITPESILKLRMPKLRSVGLSKQKATYIRDLAKLTRDGAVVFERFSEMEDEEIIAALTQVKGIGVWTVQMYLIFALRRLNVLPVGDLGVRAAMKKAYGLEALPGPAEMKRIAENWHPYCSVASWYLWRSLDNQGAV